MMRWWVQSYAREQSVVPVGVMSAVVHAAIIAAWVHGTMPGANVPEGTIANRVFYIPSPDRAPGPRVAHEVVRYVHSTLDGPGAGDGANTRTMGDARPAPASDETIGRVPPTPDTTSDHVTKPTPPAGLADSVFSILDVDTAVVRSANSAAPTYPMKLLESRVMGSVQAQYVVDTTGFADIASFTVIRSTHPEFIAAVREALPQMRFSPAKIGSLKVRQLVEQQFSFKITDTGTAATRAKKP